MASTEHGTSQAASILIVDDEEINRDLLQRQMDMLGHRSRAAGDGVAALALMQKEPPDLVILDIMMPRLDGYEVLARMRASEKLRHVPVIVISALGEMESVVQCIERGADDHLAKPFNFTLLKARIGACLQKKRIHDLEVEYRARIEEYNEELEERVRKQVREITRAQLAAIFALSKLADSRDRETGEHLERMREFCRALANQLRQRPKHSWVIDDAFIDNFYSASPLHDIGKVGVPDRILQKPERLTADEFELMKAHTTIGAATLRAVDREHPGNGFIRIGIEIAESHHERWDGSGYPRRLAGEDIPLVGRILALGDVYDALTSERCYKAPLSHEESRAIILKERGRHFDPDVVDAFLAVEDQFDEIHVRYRDSDRQLVL